MVPDFCSACSFIWGDPMKLIAFYGSSTRDKCRERRNGSVWPGWWIAHFYLASKPEEGRLGKQPHLAGSRRRHHMEMMESGPWPPERWMVFPRMGSGHADLQRSSRCQQSRDLWIAGEGWSNKASRITPGPMQGANCISLLSLAIYSSAIDSKFGKVTEGRLPTSPFPNTLRQTWNTAFLFFPQLYSCYTLPRHFIKSYL